jgi:RHS repeat-associated protein
VGAPYQFTGQELDRESELYYYGARYYDPTLSRFVSVDSIDQYSNPYAYVGNNPILRTDADGLLFEHIFDGPRWHNAERAVTADEFVEYVRGRSLEGLLHDIDKGSKSSISALGPQEEFRFVEDPADTTSIIDMRHFLVIGLQGEWIGLAAELSQIIGDPESAFDPQDFYSNALGVEFFRDFYDPEGEPLWRQLNEFFDERRSRFLGNLESIRRHPDGGSYLEQVEEMSERFELPEAGNKNESYSAGSEYETSPVFPLR